MSVVVTITSTSPLQLTTEHKDALRRSKFTFFVLLAKLFGEGNTDGIKNNWIIKLKDQRQRQHNHFHVLKELYSSFC